MQIQWAKNSYEARALPLSAQRLVNFFAEQAPKDAKDPMVLYGTPGIKTFCNHVGKGPIRGMHVMDGVLYAVSGCGVFSVRDGCVVTSLGSISSGGGGPGSGSSGRSCVTIKIVSGD